MSVNIDILSSRKGSNPGGLCYFRAPRLEFKGHFKYCLGSKINGLSSFKAENQPVYEAITFELARFLGLKTVDSFVIRNDNLDVYFDGWKEVGEINPSGRKFYFISKFIDNLVASDLNTNICCDVPEREIIYLDSLLISDIVGRKQNYIMDPNSRDSITYLDLGCSFVHAHNGFMTQPNKLKINDSKSIKRAYKILKDIHIIGRDNDSIINLSELAEMPFNMSIYTLNPWKFVKVSDLITYEEIEEIHLHLVQSLIDCLPRFKKSGIIL
ncbi:MAG: hypothetical protein QXJ28_02935 [Candidatus Pacearchaeota archaeon]